jgi:hypothetical protein
LGGAKFPEDFVIEAALGVLFPIDDLLVFLPGDGAFGAGFYRRPEFGWDGRPGEPAEAEGEIVKTTETVVGERTGGGEDGAEFVRGGVDDGFVAENIEGLRGECSVTPESS